MKANFTSSSIAKLMSNGRGAGELGKPFYTYIEEKVMEARLGRRLTNEASARPTTWGNLCELYVFGKHLDMTWYVTNETRFKHKTLWWSGAPDGYRDNTVLDIKSPFTLKSFCHLVACKSGEDLRDLNEDYFWQLVSNAILIEEEKGTPITRACLLVFCPYEKELGEIRELAASTEFISPNKTYWIDRSEDDELPYIIEGGFYKNVNIMEFNILQEWKDQLTERVTLATKIIKEQLGVVDGGEIVTINPPIKKSKSIIEVR